jgi:hypothetical protein
MSQSESSGSDKHAPTPITDALREKWKDFGIDGHGGVPFDEYQEWADSHEQLERELAEAKRENNGLHQEIDRLTQFRSAPSAASSSVPLGYCLLNAKGKMYWEEYCIYHTAGEAAAELETLHDADPEAGWRVAPFYTAPVSSASTSEDADMWRLHARSFDAFLNELYATMVDPCATGIMKRDDMMQAIKDAAISDREELMNAAAGRPVDDRGRPEPDGASGTMVVTSRGSPDAGAVHPDADLESPLPRGRRREDRGGPGRSYSERCPAAAPVPSESHATTIDAKLLDALRWDAVRYEEIVYILMNGGAISFHRARLEWVILRPDGGRSSVSGSLSTILDDGIRAGGNAPPSATRGSDG